MTDTEFLNARREAQRLKDIADHAACIRECGAEPVAVHRCDKIGRGETPKNETPVAVYASTSHAIKVANMLSRIFTEYPYTVGPYSDSDAEGPKAAPDERPYTVLFMLPDHKRSDQSCAADEVVRAHATATSADLAPDAALTALMSDCIIDPDDADDYAPVAIYAGHQFDLFMA